MWLQENWTEDEEEEKKSEGSSNASKSSVPPGMPKIASSASLTSSNSLFADEPEDDLFAGKQKPPQIKSQVYVQSFSLYGLSCSLCDSQRVMYGLSCFLCDREYRLSCFLCDKEYVSVVLLSMWQRVCMGCLALYVAVKEYELSCFLYDSQSMGCLVFYVTEYELSCSLCGSQRVWKIMNVIETNQFFLQREGVNCIVLRYKIGTESDWKSPKWGHHRGTAIPCTSMGVPPPQIYELSVCLYAS